jgi:hypothetical protein
MPAFAGSRSPAKLPLNLSSNRTGMANSRCLPRVNGRFVCLTSSMDNEALAADTFRSIKS